MTQSPADARLPLAVTCGDPAGVGPEVIASVLREDSAEAADCLLLGPRAWGEPLAASTGAAFEAVGPETFASVPGRAEDDGSRVALEAMERAAQGCLEGRFRGIVTGPVNKAALRRVGYDFPGQTEFFATRWGGEPTMAFVGRSLRVVLATWHLPLRSVPDALTPVCLERAVRRACELAERLGAAEPRIAVCGLNPHAGEEGILGREEMDVLNPALDRLRETIPGLSRCLPGDTAFFRQLRGEFDVVVASYHDQGLAAVKTLEFDHAVNVTLGLPYVRTSPDHGTAFEIAGRGVAKPDSFRSAIEVARRLTA